MPSYPGELPGGGFDMMGPIGSIGGAAIGAIGGALGAANANRNARKARDWYDKRTGEGHQRYFNMLYGPQDLHPGDYAKPGMGGPTATSGSLLGRMGGIADLYAQRAGGIRSQFDAGATALSNLYGQTEGLARGFGEGGEKLIDEEMQRQLTGANRMSKARLSASGFGNSTAVANQESQNALSAGRQGAQAKLGLRQQALDRVLGVRGQRAAADHDNIGRRADLGTNTLGAELGYRQLPINAEMMYATSNIANPWLNHNTTQYYPGYSPGGTALSTAGNALGTVGGMYLGRDLGLYGNNGNRAA